MWGYQPYGAVSANMETYSSTSIQNKFLCYLQDQNIIADSPNGPTVIGVSVETYQSLKDTATKYRDRLLELVPDEMAPPLTQEEVNEKLMAELKAEREAREKLMAYLHELTTPKQEVKANESGQDTVNGPDVSDA